MTLMMAERNADCYANEVVSFRLFKASKLLKPLRLLVYFFQGTWPRPRAERQLQVAAQKKAGTCAGMVLSRMAYERHPQLAAFVDKVAARDYAINVIGPEFVQHVFYCGTDVKQVRSTPLPRDFVIKPSHASGAAILVTTDATRGVRLRKPTSRYQIHRVHPDDFDVNAAEAIASYWLTQSYYYRPGSYPEWAYSQVTPQIIVEEYLRGSTGTLVTDYKFWMFAGECELVQVEQRINGAITMGLFDRNWNMFPFRRADYPNHGERFERPANLELMTSLAIQLSCGVEFVRVDFFDSHMGVKFAELTPYPGGGRFDFSDQNFDRGLASKWMKARSK